MAEIKFKLIKLNVSNLDALKVNISQLANRVERVQHLMKEIGEGLTELENDMNNIKVDIVRIED